MAPVGGGVLPSAPPPPPAAGGVAAGGRPGAVAGVATAACLLAEAGVGAVDKAEDAAGPDAADATARVDVIGTAFAVAELLTAESLPTPALLSKLLPLFVLFGPLAGADGK